MYKIVDFISRNFRFVAKSAKSWGFTDLFFFAFNYNNFTNFFLFSDANFVQADGTISHHDMHDYLHLTQKGYDKAFEPVNDLLIQLLTESETDHVRTEAEGSADWGKNSPFLLPNYYYKVYLAISINLKSSTQPKTYQITLLPSKLLLYKSVFWKLDINFHLVAFVKSWFS